GCIERLYAPETGNQRSVLASSQASTIPSHICGVDVRTYANGSTPLSSDLRRAASAPTLFPAQKLSRIDGTSSASVYGSAPKISVEIGVGKSMMLRPRSPR